MALTLAEFNKITDAEAYFEFFQLPYDARVVSVNRLHILKQFARYVGEIDANSAAVGEEEKLNQYRDALVQAYEVFLRVSPLQAKLFKVFQERPGNVVMLSEVGNE